MYRAAAAAVLTQQFERPRTRTWGWHLFALLGKYLDLQVRAVRLSEEVIARDLRVSRRTVIRATLWLEALGLIRVVRRYKTKNRVTVTIPGMRELETRRLTLPVTGRRRGPGRPFPSVTVLAAGSEAETTARTVTIAQEARQNCHTDSLCTVQYLHARGTRTWKEGSMATDPVREAIERGRQRTVTAARRGGNAVAFQAYWNDRVVARFGRRGASMPRWNGRQLKNAKDYERDYRDAGTPGPNARPGTDWAHAVVAYATWHWEALRERFYEGRNDWPAVPSWDTFYRHRDWFSGEYASYCAARRRPDMVVTDREGRELPDALEES